MMDSAKMHKKYSGPPYPFLGVLYDTVLKVRPLFILEFGPLFGKTTIAMAKALQVVGQGRILTSDIWMKRDIGGVKVADKEVCQKNFVDAGVDGCISMRTLSFYDWLNKPERFDLMYFDVDNDGEKLVRLHKGVKDQIEKGSVVLFDSSRPGIADVQRITDHRALYWDKSIYSLSAMADWGQWEHLCPC